MEILFPSQYKKALLSGKKTSTVRLANEIGKYEAGKVYRAKSYSGRDWGVRVLILEVIRTNLGRLSEYGIPQRSIEATCNKEGVSLEEKVELVRFRLLPSC